MGKVILITSRQFDDYKKDKDRLPVSSDYVKLFLESNEDNHKGIGAHLRHIDAFKCWFEKDSDDTIIIKEKPDNQPLQDDALNKINDQINNLLFLQLFNDDEDCKRTDPNFFVSSLEQYIINNKKTTGVFHAGVFKLAEADGVFVFIAEEYPYLNEDDGVFSIDKQCYLDAIIGIVIKSVEQEAGAIEEMIIVSHDVDWGKKGEMSIPNVVVSEEMMPNLFNFINNQNSTEKECAQVDEGRTVAIHCFQHDELHSKYYPILKKTINDPVALYNALHDVSPNIYNFDNYLNTGEGLFKIDFEKPFLSDSICPDIFLITN